MGKTPRIIYLQTAEEGEEDDECDITWCVDRMEPTDTPYIRKDVYNALRETYRTLKSKRLRYG